MRAYAHLTARRLACLVQIRLEELKERMLERLEDELEELNEELELLQYEDGRWLR